MHRLTSYLLFGLCVSVVYGCKKAPTTTHTMYDLDLEHVLTAVPEGFEPLEHPEDNAFTIKRWQLGKRLFFDPALSKDYSTSCASCHKQTHAFADDQAVSPGVEGRKGTRNAPSLANVAYHPYYTREGGVPTLEMQVLVPVQEHAEFDFNMVLLSERLNEDSSYVHMSNAAYDRNPDPFVITRALAVFERTLISGNSAYDAFNSGRENALSDSQQKGMALFFSERTSCSECHSGIDFTDYSFQNNGLYENYLDRGRMRLTVDSSDYALFKVPSLRNVGLTAPYMHDGSVSSLQDVVKHYNKGGHNHPQKSELIRPLKLSETEMQELVDFLEALTDSKFISNPIFHEE